MDAAELLVRSTIWLSLAAYTAGEAGRCGVWSGLGESRSRLVWTLGCGLYLAHVAAAFSYRHGWSHADAYTSTAEQTAAVVGMDWGGGIFLNYAFTVLWVWESARWWLAPDAYRGRPRWVGRAVRGVFFFMILNGAVVFVGGAMRWVGLAIVTTLATVWYRGTGAGGPPAPSS